MRPIILIVILLIAVGAMFLVYSLLAGDSKPERELVQQPKVIEKQVAEKLVYVAREEIPVGTVIEQEMLDRQAWPEKLIGPGFVVAGDKAPPIVGMISRSHFQPREVILTSKLGNPNDPSFLAATLPEGMRAVTISVNGITGVAGFVYPGDRVDVLLTHTLLSEAEKAAAEMSEDEDDKLPKDYNKPITEIVTPDVRVLAIDSKAMAGNDKEAQGKKRMPSSITLELSQADAQRIRLAEREGELSLVLRSLKDKGISLVRPTAESDLTRTLPPGYFPELYDFDAEFTEDMVSQKAKKEKESTKTVITVVRGSKVEELEIKSEE